MGRERASGVLYAVAAYGTWGLLPAYWKLLGALPATEILAHRVLWTALFTALLLTVLGRWGEFRSALSDRRERLALLAPFALLALGWLGGGALRQGTEPERALLVGAGVVTALPLIWFAAAARRLRFTTLGLFQYLAPTLSFALAIAVYGEPFSRAQAFAFVCIWVALAICSAHGLRHASRLRAAAATATTAAAPRA